MQMVHARLKALPDREDPLQIVAKDFSAQARVLCFDEFFVADIADAMLLGRLLQCLFEDGVTLVATSNLAPDNLYRDGLQRVRFLPAIRSLKTAHPMCSTWTASTITACGIWKGPALLRALRHRSRRAPASVL